MVRVMTCDREDKKTYGAVLYLDGQRIFGKKTFTGSSCFPGYKKGDGLYDEFTFTLPDFSEEGNRTRHLNLMKNRLEQQN